jgi:hypothetical protein
VRSFSPLKTHKSLAVELVQAALKKSRALWHKIQIQAAIKKLKESKDLQETPSKHQKSVP